MVKRKKAVIKELPLIAESKNRLTVNLFNNDATRMAIPLYVRENLKHNLRSYQQEALNNLNWTQYESDADIKYNHLMFNMATGSGKTDLMASIILYMYGKFNYQNFLFVANTNAVVEKTKINFLNSASDKYLFRDPINIEGRRININSVDRFSNHVEPGEINIKLTTIQSLANELDSIRENGLTFDDLKDKKIVILADEAHHFNANTKKEKLLEHSWETLLDRIRQSNSKNRQFEFTATIDIDKEEVYQKYRDKIIYKYDLNQYMNDGYSKTVRRLESNNNDQVKMLNAVLLSQYRKRVAKSVGIENFKPVILFKSNLVKVSKEAENVFFDLIDNLSSSSLVDFLTEQQKITNSNALTVAYSYWLKQDMSATVAELKRDFQRLTCINVNDSSKEGILGDTDRFNQLNTLENFNNPIRVIFAVAKLTEGWDVLNLYDIVRIGEQATTINQTNSEAQLIGRGARYYPFVYKGEKSYVRRFDKENTDLSILEKLFYHTINDSKYLNNLHNSFNKINLVSESDNNSDYTVYTATVKPGFKRSLVYKQGYLYKNRLEDVPKEEFNNIGAYGLDYSQIVINYNEATYESDVDDEFRISDQHTDPITIADFSKKSDQRLIRKAISRNRFYRFDELSKWLPTLRSMNEFLTSDKWLGNLKVRANIAYNVGIFDIEKRCHIVEEALRKVQQSIVSNYRKQRGTKVFEPVAISDVVADYQKRVPLDSTGIDEVISADPMDNKSWYVYDVAIVDRLEKEFIDMIQLFITDNKLEEKYKSIYLIRNEETVNKFKIYEYEPSSNVHHYEAFMPDFILYIDNGNINYQIFVEPKGDHILLKDQWKENLLENLDPNDIEIIGENDSVRLLGVKFYTRGDSRETEKELGVKLGLEYKGFNLDY